MKITVTASPSDLRDMPLERYAPALQKLIRESYDVELGIDDIEVKSGPVTSVLFDGQTSKSDVATDILSMAQELTHPAVRNRYFG